MGGRGQTGSLPPPAQAPVQVSAPLPLSPPPPLIGPPATSPWSLLQHPLPGPPLAFSLLPASEPMVLIKAVIERLLHAKQCAEVAPPVLGLFSFQDPVSILILQARGLGSRQVE